MTRLNIELVPTTPRDEPILSRLAQLYAHDFSEFMELDLGDDALFGLADMLVGCWSEGSRHAFVCRVDAHLAGFVILDEHSRLTGDPEVVDVAQFFITRRYRRRGIGTACAAKAFDLFARKWEVRQTAANHDATAFWRRAIQRYTGGRFREVFVDDNRWHGPVQSFDGRAVRAARPD